MTGFKWFDSSCLALKCQKKATRRDRSDLQARGSKGHLGLNRVGAYLKEFSFLTPHPSGNRLE